MTKNTANEDWKQLSFVNSVQSNPLWFTPDSIKPQNVTVPTSSPRFLSSATEVASDLALNFEYDLGPVGISIKSGHYDYISIKCTWNLNSHSMQKDKLDFHLVRFNVDFKDLLEKATEPIKLMESDYNSLFVTFFLEGIRSAVKAIAPPKIKFSAIVRGGISEAAILTLHFTLYITMRKINSKVYMLEEQTALEHLRIGELFATNN